MLLEQSAKNTDVHWNAVFRRTTWYLKNLMILALAPWMVLSILMMIGLLDEYFTGELGRNGGMTGLFQSIGLHPHTTYETLLWIIGSGVFLAMAWLLWHTVAALFKAAGRKIRKTKLGVWITRKPMSLGNTLDHFGRAHLNTLASLVIGTVIVAAFFMGMPPAPKNRMIVMPPAGMQIVQVSPYSRVLLEVPVPVRKHPNGMPRPATRTISGKAMVTQIGPQTYQVRMVP
ncbi:hypothetical protein GGI1_02215 [Acidithiobacillus sp. GGI-221]|nr:hypothetical protein GGI1_02215 [Acidithiobacillus sp. GGI-221]